ncbi:MAG: hypothetical protein ACOC6J_11050, partial [Spirochaetota bacterium]
SKIGGVAPFVTGPLEDVDIVVTDSGIGEEYESALEERGIRVIVAPVEADVAGGPGPDDDGAGPRAAADDGSASRAAGDES